MFLANVLPKKYPIKNSPTDNSPQENPKVTKFQIIKPNAIKDTIGKMLFIGLFTCTSYGLVKPFKKPKKTYRKKYFHINI
tara:strand:- start:75 stop:314 length:240 start_codon:yes stop_codon:yes gene_type:complete